MAAVRVLELRTAYAREGFDWEQLQREAIDEADKANQALMAAFMERQLGEGVAAAAADEGGSEAEGCDGSQAEGDAGKDGRPDGGKEG